MYIFLVVALLIAASILYCAKMANCADEEMGCDNAAL